MKNKTHTLPTINNKQFFTDVCHIIEDGHYRLAVTINAGICLLYWHVGRHIKTERLNEKRAGYGRQVIKKLAENLAGKYGRGWGFPTLQHCARAAYTFSEDEIAYAVRTQLTHDSLALPNRKSFSRYKRRQTMNIYRPLIALGTEIDRLVYSLYNFIPAEIQIVEAKQ